jgi:uncharacterized membrane protein YbhN (UPF0104 family)
MPAGEPTSAPRRVHDVSGQRRAGGAGPASWARLLGGAAVVAALIARFGAAPFGRGLAMADPGILVLAAALTAVATGCCAWRWCRVSGALGLDLPLGEAFAACYRSQFLNATLPGGVLGDAHRALVRGRAVGRPGRVAGTVAWERGLGLVVQAAVTVGVVALLPTPLGAPVLMLVGTASATLVLVVVVGGLLGHAGPLTAALGDVGRLVRAPRAALATVAASVVVTCCHAAVLAVAVQHAAGGLPLTRLLPLVLVVQLGSAVPTSLAGWGPREGVAAWAFATMGLDAADGIAASVVYGVVALVATVPGAFVLAHRTRRPVLVESAVDG